MTGAFPNYPTNETIELVRAFMADVQDRQWRPSAPRSEQKSIEPAAQEPYLVPTPESVAVQQPTREERVAQRQWIEEIWEIPEPAPEPSRLHARALEVFPELQPPVYDYAEEERILRNTRDVFMSKPDTTGFGVANLVPSGRTLLLLILGASAFLPFGALLYGVLSFASWSMFFLNLGAEQIWATVSQFI